MLCLRKNKRNEQKFTPVQSENWTNGKPDTNLELEGCYIDNDHRMSTEHNELSNSSSNSSNQSAAIDNSNLPAEYKKTITVFIVMMLIFVANLLSSATLHDRSPTTKQDRKLAYPPLRDISHDIGFELHSDASVYLLISEIILIATTVSLVGLLIFHPQKSIIFRRMFFLLTILFTVRLITMNVTTLPTSSNALYKCAKPESFAFGILINRFFEMISTCGLSVTENIKYCGNYVYSGHTVILVLNCLMTAEYCPLNIVNWPMKALTVCSIILILLSGFDYTISIIIAYYATTRVFWMYHTFANNHSLKEFNRTNKICKEWWYPVFQYLEGNIKDIVPPIYGFI